MLVKTVETYQELSLYVANEWCELLKQKPASVICVASGDSPKLACALFCEQAKAQGINTSHFFFIGLDEWVGLAPETVGSCHNDFQKRIIQPLGLQATQYHMFNALSNNLEKECKKMDAIIASKGGIDLMIVGIGMNGHIGFNEPGVDFSLLSHVIDLDETTVSVGQKYFQQKVLLEKGITLGLAHLMNTKQVFLMANGERKATVITKTVEDAVTNQFPASIMQQHENSVIIIDKEAASLLKN